MKPPVISAPKCRESDMPQIDYGSQRRWHIDKTVNISHILATIAIAGTLFGFVSRMDQRVTVLEERLAAQTMHQQAAVNDLKEVTRDLRDEFRGLRSDIIRLLNKIQVDQAGQR